MKTNKAMQYTSAAYMPVEDRKRGPFDQYDIQEALRTIVRANKIRKNPALMRAIRAEAQRQLEAAKQATKL